MNTRPLFAFAISLLIQLAIATATAAPANVATVGKDGEEEIEPISWPSEKRVATKPSPKQLIFDGYPIDYFELRIGDAAYKLNTIDKLAPAKTTNPKFNILLETTDRPQVTLGISVFEKSEFLPGLDEASWTAYKIGLQQTRANLVVELENDNISQKITPRIFGAPFRQIVYSVGDTKHREIFAFHDGKLWVFSVFGHRDAVDQQWRRINSVISKISK